MTALPRFAPALLALVATLLPLPALAARPLDPPPSELPRALRYELDNGLRVVLVPNAGNPILEVQLGFMTGSGADPAGREGAASLLGRMTTAGLADLPEQALAKELARLGAWLAADVSSDTFGIGGQIPTFSETDVRRFLELFAAVVLDNPIDPEILEREKTLRAGLFARVLDNPEALAEVAARMVALGDGPHGRQTFGSPTSVAAVTRDDLVFFRDRVFTPKNAVLVIGGAFDPEAMLAWLEARFGAWDGTAITLEAGALPGRFARLCKDGRCLDNPLAAAPSHATRRETVLIETDDPNLSQIPYRLVAPNPVPMTSPKWPAFRLGTFILGGDFTSRLMQTLRVREGLTYGAYFSPSFGAHLSGAMMVSSDATPDALVKAIPLALDEVARLRREPIPSEELERSRKMMTESFAFKFETISNTLEQYLTLETSALPLRWLADWKRVLASPSAADIQAAMGALDPDALALVVAGPPSLRTTLQALGHGPVRVVSSRDLIATGLSNAKPL